MGKRSFPGPTSCSIYRYRFRDYPYSGLGMLERASVSNLQYSCNVPLRASGVERGLKWVESLEWTEGPRLAFGVWLAAPQATKAG